MEERILSLENGQCVDWKFGLVTRTVQRITENLFVIHDMSSGWLTADVTKEQMEKLLQGELSITRLNWA